MQLTDIDGRQVFVVLHWIRNAVAIVAVCDSKKEAKKRRKQYANDAPDPSWERESGSRRNNTFIEEHFINAPNK